MTPKAHNGLVHYFRSGREVKETPTQVWLHWFDLRMSPDPTNLALADQLKQAMDQADEQSKVMA